MKARGRQDLYSFSFHLFRRGEAVEKVAHCLRISRDEALRLKYLYLTDFSEVTNYYIYENERRRQELVEQLFKNLQNLQRHSAFIRRYFPDAVVLNILLFSSA